MNASNPYADNVLTIKTVQIAPFRTLMTAAIAGAAALAGVVTGIVAWF